MKTILYKKMLLKDAVKNKLNITNILVNILKESVNCNDYSFLANSYYENLLRYIKDNTAYVICAFFNDELIAFHWCYEIIVYDETRFHSNFIGVSEKFQNMHIASNMLEYIEQEAKRRHITKLECNVLANNKSSIKYHLKNGYECKQIKMVKKIKEI